MINRSLDREAGRGSGRPPSAAAGARRGPHTIWPWLAYDVLEYARSRTRGLVAIGHLLTEHVNSRLFAFRCRLAKSEHRALTLALPVTRALTPNYGSLCELAGSPRVPADVFCLSRTAAGRRRAPRWVVEDGGAAFRKIERVLLKPPDTSPLIGGCNESAHGHYCWRYMFSLGSTEGAAPVRRNR